MSTNSLWLQDLARQLAVELPRVPDKALWAIGRSLPGGYRHAAPIRTELKRQLNAGLLRHGQQRFTELVRALPEHEALLNAPRETLLGTADRLEEALGKSRWLLHVITLPKGTFSKEQSGDSRESPSSTEQAPVPVVEILPEPLPHESLESLRRVLSPPADPLPATEPPAAGLAEAIAEASRLRDRLNKARDESEELRRARRALKEQHAGELEAVKGRHAAALDALQADLDSALSLRDLAQRERDEAVRAAELRARERFDALYAEEVAPWLARAKTDHELLRTKSSGWQTALELARDAEAAQREHDRSAGNRIEILNALNSLREARSRLDDLQRHSLHPLPSLAIARDRVEREMRDLERRLDPDAAPKCPIAAGLSSVVNAAGSTARLAQLRESVESLCASGVLAQAEKPPLIKAIDARLATLVHAANPARSCARPVQPPVFLREFLANKTPGTLFIDGHNLIFDWMPYLGMKRDRAHHPENREALRQAVRTLASRHPEIDFRLVYDGDTPVISNDTDIRNLRVEFSGRSLDGNRNHRADDFIVSTARFLREARPTQRIASVTDDNAIRADLTRLGALAVKNAELLNLLPSPRSH